MGKRNTIKQFFHHGCLLMGISAITNSALVWDFAEHCKISDRAMSLFPHYLVGNGIFPSEAVADSVLLQILSMSHMPGSNAYAMSELTQLSNIMTCSTLCGLADDHVENPISLETDLQTYFPKASHTLALETQTINELLTGVDSKKLFDINLAYGILAIEGLSHFYAYGKGLNEHPKVIDPESIRRLQRPSEVNRVFDKLDQSPSINKYFCAHTFAVYLAQEAGKEVCKGDTQAAGNLMFYAAMCEAFAEYFLRDSFASGHQMVRRDFSASVVSNNKNLYDFYNTIPVQAANLRGETWSAYGSKCLNRNMMEYSETDDYRYIRVTEEHPYSLEKDDSYERGTKVFYQIAIATYESIVEVWKAYQNALEGSGENILNEIPSERDDLPQFVYGRFPVIKNLPVPFGTGLDDIPLEASVADRKDGLQLIVQEPFTRNFIRLRVVSSFMFLIGTPIHSNRDSAMTYGDRLNVSMTNWHKFGKGEDMVMEPGGIAHWVSPTISGYYMHAPSPSYMIKNWNVKAGVNYNMDIFVSPKRFLGLHSYFEVGIDRHNDEIRFLVAPSVGIQLGSLISVHSFNISGWLRISLGIALPLKFAVTCNKVVGRPVK